MNSPGQSAGSLSDTARAGLANVLDVLLPGTDSLPSGRDIEAQNELLDRVVTADPSLLRVLSHVGELAAGSDACTLADVELWSGHDVERLVFALHAAYYMSKDVRQALGYPGQQRRPIALATADELCSDELIAPVVARGPIYVPTP